MQYKRRIIFLAGFLFSIPLALTSYVNSSYLKEYLSDGEIGIFYAIASVLAIICLIKMPKFLTRYGNKSIMLFCSLLATIALLIIAFSKNYFLILSSFAIFFIATDLILASLDIFVEDFSKNISTGKIRGIYLTCVNLAWVIAQIISGSIIAKSSFTGIYIFSSLFIILMMLSFIFLLSHFRDPKYKKISLSKTIKFFWQNKKASKIYLISFTLRFFFAWMVIYTPIYLNHIIGFSWNEIGIIFSIMLLPFVLLTYPLGRLSDKIGERKMLIIGFIIMAISTLLIPFLEIKSVLLFACVLFTTRVGAAIIEAMSEIYFFKIVDEENVDEISFFKNIYPLSFVVAPALGSLFLIFIPSVKYLFLILVLILLLGLLVSIRLRDVK